MKISTTPFKISALAAAIALTACGGDDSSSKSNGLSSTSEGTAIISAKGANGTLEGGNGGSVSVSKFFSSSELNVSVKGAPDTDYDLPEFEPNLGANPAIINTNTTIRPYDATYYAEEGRAFSSGDLYYHNNAIYRFNGELDDSDEPVLGKFSTLITGIQVDAGATLSLATNNSSFNINLVNDMVNNGTVTTINLLITDTDVDTDNRPNLTINSVGYLATGAIDLVGFSKDYPNGRSLNINSSYISNSGNINTSGYSSNETDATSGGDSGNINLYTEVFVENNGALSANGGGSETDYAGEGGSINFESNLLIANNGALTVNGGTGANISNANDTGNVNFESYQTLINTGEITGLGSNETDGAEGGEGGTGANVYFGMNTGYGYGLPNSEDPRLVNTGNINVTGGSTGGDYTGGEGGQIEFDLYESIDGGEGRSQPALMVISGNLIADGHSSSSVSEGGDGGDIDFYHYSNATNELPMHIVGYETIDISAGSGAQSGGTGGNLNIISSSNTTYSYIYAPAGPIAIETNIKANGGDAIFNTNFSESNGNAGSAGDISISTYVSQIALQKEITEANIEFEGNIELTGGSSTGFKAGGIDSASGDDGGDLSIIASDSISIKGNLMANGGSSDLTGTDDTNYRGGEAGHINATSKQGDVSLNMDISINSGSAANYSDYAGNIHLIAAEKTILKGTISAIGGNTDSSIAGTQGGNGGQFYLYSLNENYSSTDDVTLAGGAGEATGWNGGITEGLTCILGACTGSIDLADLID
jgi:hypothetical protein